MGTDIEVKNKGIILFDGVCNLCNNSVNFILDWDKKDYFLFSSLQSAEAKTLGRDYGFSVESLSSIVLIIDGKTYSKSSAALKIARNLSGLWPVLYAFILVPKPIRDAVYNWIARNRYKWFGRRDVCRVPEPHLREKFLENRPLVAS